MKMKVFIIFLCVSLCASAEDTKSRRSFSDDELYPVKDGYLVLNKHNFQAAVFKFRFVLTLYYGNNKESNAAQDEFQNIFNELDKTNSAIRLAKINIREEPEIVSKYPILGTPTIRLYKNGNVFDYVGKITVDRIITWLDLAMTVPLQVNTANELESLTATTCVILGCFPGQSPEKVMNNFYKVSEYFVYDKHLPIPRFAVITSAKLAREVGAVSGSIAVYKKFEDGAKSIFNGDSENFEELLNFVQAETVPIVFKSHIEEYLKYMYGKASTFQHILFMSSKDRNYNDAFKSFKEAASKFKDQEKGKEVTFFHVDLNEEHKKTLEYYHINPDSDLPCNRITKTDRFHSRFLPPKKDFTTSGFTDFTNAVIDDKIKRNIISEELPSDWDNYDVKIVVGKTFDDFVNDEKRTVFMLFYTPDDATSLTVLPLFNELAEEFKSNATLLFGKMNVANNDGEIGAHAKIPSIKMYPPSGKSRFYELPLKKSPLKTFIMTNGKNQLKDSIELPKIDFDVVERHHPFDAVEDEKRRRKLWEEEEKELLSKYVVEIEGEDAHENEAFMERHPFEHLPLEHWDPEYMNTDQHVDFENIDQWELHYHEEL